MQSILTRGARRLLVAAGVISLVLSVVAPAAVSAAKPDDTPGIGTLLPGSGETGTIRVRLCHAGHVIEVDDDGDLNGHAHHDDDFVLPADDTTAVGEPCSGGDGGTGGEGTTVLVCRDGLVVQLADVALVAEDDGLVTEPGPVVGDVCGAGDGGGEGTTAVLLCHSGRVIEVDDDAALGAHTDHGDEPAAEGAVVGDECGAAVVTPPVTPPVVDPADPGVEVLPGAPVEPTEPAGQPKPIVIISDDAVTRPTPAPSVAAPTPSGNEVLGAVTTRTPTAGAGPLDPGAPTTLAATGLDSTSMLLVLGSVLLLSGMALELLGRRRASATA